MRLGDLDALYRKVKTECNPYGKPTIDFESGKKVLKIIENEPTVTPERALMDKLKGNEERPQGEWKETGYETGALGITYRQTQCSNCSWEHALPMWYNFCPNCGSAMRKSGANMGGKEE